MPNPALCVFKTVCQSLTIRKLNLYTYKCTWSRRGLIVLGPFSVHRGYISCMTPQSSPIVCMVLFFSFYNESYKRRYFVKQIVKTIKSVYGSCLMLASLTLNLRYSYIKNAKQKQIIFYNKYV